MRSTIGLAPVVRKNMEALGLHKRFQTVYQKVSPSTAHRLLYVKELVKVELVDSSKSAKQMRLDRKFEPGFTVIKDGAKKVYQ